MSARYIVVNAGPLGEEPQLDVRLKLFFSLCWAT